MRGLGWRRCGIGGRKALEELVGNGVDAAAAVVEAEAGGEDEGNKEGEEAGSNCMLLPISRIRNLSSSSLVLHNP